jgi:undecaprenyl phosphate-alpha-L-ara4N flippase subunit ArnF
MLQIAAGYAFALGCALIVIAGDTVLKAAAESGRATLSPPILVGCVFYAVSALAWFWSMRHITMVQGAVAYTMFSLIALCLIGALYFDEVLQAREYAGIACALAAVVLMIRVA